MSRDKSSSRGGRSVLLGFGERYRDETGHWKIRLRWIRLLTLCGVLSVLGYLAMMTAIWGFFKYKKDFGSVSWSKTLVLWARWDEHQREFGDYEIARAMTYYKAGDPNKAIHFLRAGLRRSPDNVEGRVTLARMYSGYRPDFSIELLEDKLRDNVDNRDYVNMYFRALLGLNRDKEVVERADQLIPLTKDEDIRRLLALFKVIAHTYRGEYDEAEEVVDQYDMTADTEGFLIDAALSWARGQKQTAIDKLEAGKGRFQNPMPILNQLTSYYLQIDNLSQARRYTVLRNSISPLAIEPKIDLLNILRRTGDKERKKRELAKIREQFTGDAKATKLLSTYAAQDGDYVLANKLIEEGALLDVSEALLAINYMKACVRGGNPGRAIEFADNQLLIQPEWLEKHQSSFSSIRALAYYAEGEVNLSATYLDEFLSDLKLHVSELLMVADQYEKLGGLEEARKIMSTAYKNNPNNQGALTKLIQLDLALGNSAQLGEYLETLLNMRRPSRILLEDAYRELSSDRFIFSEDREKILIELAGLLGQI